MIFKLLFGLSKLRDINQVNKEMTKDAQYHSYYEKSSQQSSEEITKDLADLTRGRNGHCTDRSLGVVDC